MVAFNEVKKSQKYGEMYGEGVRMTSENYFLKVKVAFVIFGMLYCGIMVVRCFEKKIYFDKFKFIHKNLSDRYNWCLDIDPVSGKINDQRNTEIKFIRNSL